MNRTRRRVLWHQPRVTPPLTPGTPSLPVATGTLGEYHEYPDGTQVFANDTGAECCDNCGGNAFLQVYREYPDGTQVLVGDTAVCCGCSGLASPNRLQEYREYSDGTQRYVQDTGACCECPSDADDCEPFLPVGPLCAEFTSAGCPLLNGKKVQFTKDLSCGTCCYRGSTTIGGRHFSGTVACTIYPPDCIYGAFFLQLCTDDDGPGKPSICMLSFVVLNTGFGNVTTVPAGNSVCNDAATVTLTEGVC